MGEFLNTIPEDLKYFLVVTFLSLLIGLEQRGLHKGVTEESEKPVFGTDRTFAFIGILGFILFILAPKTLILFIGGGVVLTLLLGIYYYGKIKEFKSFGLTSVMIAFITYCLGPLVKTQEPWLVLLIFVSVILLAELKPTFASFSKKFENEEFTTLAKFLILAGVILPILPEKKIATLIPVTPYQIWLAVVIISGISYLSYLLQKFVFQKSGLVVTAILGGLYSSTATTLILARKSKRASEKNKLFASSIVLSSAMMYVRILVIAFIFNLQLGYYLALPMFLLCAFSVIIGYLLYRRNQDPTDLHEDLNMEQTNPLELKVGLIFAFLFVLFSTVTHFALEYYGTSGVKGLSFLVGVTDITPYLINLFEGDFPLEMTEVAKATMIAIASNNLMKSIYTTILSRRSTKWFAGISLVIMFAVTLLASFWI